MRIAFTIILNGLHHLQHNNYFDNAVKNYDLWVFVDGLSLPGGSTSWCKKVGDEWHKDFHSNDGTIEFIQERGYPNVVLHCDHAGAWPSKDAMVNTAIDIIKNNECYQIWSGNALPVFLWQCDADEMFTAEQLDESERELIARGADCGAFLADYYVGPKLLARGEWGEGCNARYPLRSSTIRLWQWHGSRFKHHEPPVMEETNGRIVVLKPRFKHYAYFFEKDVRFKNEFYSGHEGILKKWQRLQEETNFPQPLSELISGPWGKTNTVIVKVA